MRYKPILLLLFACITFQCLHAQTMYHFQYNFKGEDGMEYYDAFMMRYDDGTGFIRVNYTDGTTGKKYLVDMDMEESYDVNGKTGAPDSSLLYFSGIDPVVISGDTSEGYDPDIYVFEKKENDEYYDPLEVISVADDNTLSEGEFTDAKLLDAADLTEDFVSRFFSKDEEFYKSLFDKTTTRNLTNDEKSSTLHLIIVANTNDPDIGNTCKLDINRTQKFYSDLSEFVGIKMDTVTIFGNNYNKNNVDLAIESLKTSPRDIVVFYYTGHGFSKNDNYQYPYMELRSKSFQSLDLNSINIEDIYTRIKQKGARLSLVISDCCNTLPGTAPAASGDIALTRSSDLGWSLNNCFQLFFPPNPVSILMTAATKGEESAGNNSYGGFFTYILNQVLLNFVKPGHELTGITWNKILDQAKSQTVRTPYPCTLPDGSKSKCYMHPVYKLY